MSKPSWQKEFDKLVDLHDIWDADAESMKRKGKKFIKKVEIDAVRRGKKEGIELFKEMNLEHIDRKEIKKHY